MMSSVACEQGNSVEPYQVRRIAFEYEESPGTYKVRPVVVGVVEVERGDALLVKVTGHGPRPEFPGEIRLSDWQYAGLSKPSTVRCSKTVVVSLADVAASELLGSLSWSDACAVRQGLIEAGKIAEL